MAEDKTQLEEAMDGAFYEQGRESGIEVERERTLKLIEKYEDCEGIDWNNLTKLKKEIMIIKNKTICS